jgi:hypothetical protein
MKAVLEEESSAEKVFKALRGINTGVRWMMKEIRELVLRARSSWEIIREFQSGKDVGKEELGKAVVELRDCLLRVSMLILPLLFKKGFKPEEVRFIILDPVTTLKEKVFDPYLSFLEVFSDNSTRRVGLAILLSTAPSPEVLLTFLETITKEIDDC